MFTISLLALFPGVISVKHSRDITNRISPLIQWNTCVFVRSAWFVCSRHSMLSVSLNLAYFVRSGLFVHVIPCCHQLTLSEVVCLFTSFHAVTSLLCQKWFVCSRHSMLSVSLNPAYFVRSGLFVHVISCLLCQEWFVCSRHFILSVTAYFVRRTWFVCLFFLFAGYLLVHSGSTLGIDLIHGTG